MSQRLPSDRRAAALAYFGLVRAYWRLAKVAQAAGVDDAERVAIEKEAIAALPPAITALPPGALAESGSAEDLEDAVLEAESALRAVFDGTKKSMN